jgi:hypothetical protein
MLAINQFTSQKKRKRKKKEKKVGRSNEPIQGGRTANDHKPTTNGRHDKSKEANKNRDREDCVPINQKKREPTNT